MAMDGAPSILVTNKVSNPQQCRFQPAKKTCADHDFAWRLTLRHTWRQPGLAFTALLGGFMIPAEWRLRRRPTAHHKAPWESVMQRRAIRNK
ncbi:hypothetical protein IF2G_02557 [Cordyceps javanica]|nr:hypothetical protein IF2G_02557 [Cordyceps javanica]